MNYLQMPRLKEDQTLPEILSREEMARLLERCENPKHRAMFSLAYGSGLRVSEICRLRVQDIDSKQMRIFIRGSKGNKDRYTILSQQCLGFLRDYWRRFRPNHPEGLLFPGCKNITSITERAINDALKKWLTVAGILERCPSIPFVMVLPHIFWKTALTFLRSRSCWDTVVYPPLRFIYIWKMLEQTLSALPTALEIMGAELQDIFAAHMTPYLESHHLSFVQWKAAQSIVDCRTAVLGAHIDTCANCGHTRISYNSCRNRHCPKCQTVAKETWIEKQR